MVSGNGEIEKRLWATADQLRANSGLKASEYSTPVLGLIFLRYADYKFSEAEKTIVVQGSKRGQRITRPEGCFMCLLKPVSVKSLNFRKV